MKIIIYPLSFVSGIYLSFNFFYQFSHIEDAEFLNKKIDNIEEIVEGHLNRENPPNCEFKVLQSQKNMSLIENSKATCWQIC